jgi:LPS-assembly protein
METRYFPQASLQTSYPMVRPFESFQAKIEPVVSITGAPNMALRNNIPNEDSQNAQIDASNLFEPNRFPGLDRVEDQSRVTYGLRTGVFGYDDSSLDMFIGQSYRLDERNNPFPNGSGLEDQESDVVGSISGNYKDVYSVDYRYQLGGRHLTSQRHEVDATADWNRFRLRTNYLFARALEGTDINESREQLKSSADFYFTPEWRLRGGATQDLGADPGLRETYASIDYLGQCLFWSLQAEKNFTNDVSGENDVAVVFRIGLKNLGEFEESSYRQDVTQN